MFYIHKRRTYPKREIMFTHIGAPLIAFAALISLTAWSWTSANRSNQQDLTDKLNHSVEQVNATLRSGLEVYDNMLRSSASFIDSSRDISPQQWDTFVAGFDIGHHYPDIVSMGYAQVAHPTSMPIMYEYHTPTTTSTLDVGYNMYSNAVMRSALETARDSGAATMTAPARPRQAAPTDQNLNLTMFMPLYKHGQVPATQAARQANVTGFVYITFRPRAFIGRTTVDDNTQFGFQIYDSTESTPLYENRYNKNIVRSDTIQTLKQTMPVENRQWNIVGSTNVSALSQTALRRPSAVLWGGTVLSLLVAGSMYLLLLNRTRLLADHEAGEIQEAKDELLALASHQLRTPATGVKQYIGMLREGYAGPLTTEQQTYVDKAYKSNERQLGTINDMLVVAKADTGHLELTKTSFDLNQLIEEIVEETMPSITARQQVITLYMPSRHVHLYGDERFLRMAIENIINNATKYTPEKGTITVTTLRKKGKLSISVRDTGVGIRRGDRALLFQKFSRIPNELTNKVGGSGIGLYLAQKILEQHNGKITYKSAPSEGSVFTIVLPETKEPTP